jgi:hypothetical protein
MPQAEPVCATSILLCAMRITRLNADGSLAAGPNNAYITNSPVSLQFSPNIKTGITEQQVGGCGCVCVSYKGPDTLLYFDLDFEFCKDEPALYEIMAGMALVTDDSDTPVAIGNSWPNQLSCSLPQQPPFAIEAWAQNFIDDHQVPDPAAYTRYVWPMAFANLDQQTLGAQFTLPKLKGWTRTNPNWPADGAIYNDYPVGAELEQGGGKFQDSSDHVPVAECAYQTASSAA